MKVKTPDGQVHEAIEGNTIVDSIVGRGAAQVLGTQLAASKRLNELQALRKSQGVVETPEEMLKATFDKTDPVHCAIFARGAAAGAHEVMEKIVEGLAEIIVQQLQNQKPGDGVQINPKKIPEC